MFSHSRMSAGREFQVDGATTEKARRASSVCMRGTTSIGASEERRARGGSRVCTSSLRYVGKIGIVFWINLPAFCLVATSLTSACVLLSTLSGRPHLRSSGDNKLFVPRSLTASTGPRAFCSSGPTSWNTLPARLRHSSLTLEQFKCLRDCHRTCLTVLCYLCVLKCLFNIIIIIIIYQYKYRESICIHRRFDSYGALCSENLHHHRHLPLRF